MRSHDFFAAHPVFTHEEFVAAHTAGGRSSHTSNNLLAQHVASGRLLRIRRGLYATVPRGVPRETATVDPYLLATKLTPDAVVAYHAALQFHGRAYSIWNRFHYLTSRRARRFTFRGVELVPVLVPAELRRRPDLGGGVVTVRHAGGHARVTTLERALVDVLDSPEKCGGWEEIWRSLEMVEFFDLDAVISHVEAFDSPLTAARVGFYLEQHREPLLVEERHLERLRRHALEQPRYLDASRTRGKLVSRWNLIVPDVVLTRAWGEVA